MTIVLIIIILDCNDFVDDMNYYKISTMRIEIETITM